MIKADRLLKELLSRLSEVSGFLGFSRVRIYSPSSRASIIVGAFLGKRLGRRAAPLTSRGGRLAVLRGTRCGKQTKREDNQEANAKRRQADPQNLKKGRQSGELGIFMTLQSSLHQLTCAPGSTGRCAA
jgi:hypothetical protein